MHCYLALTILIKGQADFFFIHKAALANLCGGQGHNEAQLEWTRKRDTCCHKRDPHTDARLTVYVCGRRCISAIKTGYELEFSI